MIWEELGELTGSKYMDGVFGFGNEDCLSSCWLIVGALFEEACGMSRTSFSGSDGVRPDVRVLILRQETGSRFITRLIRL